MPDNLIPVKVLDKSLEGCDAIVLGGGSDDSFSLEEPELKVLCDNAETAWQALGKVDYGRKSSEQGNVKFRRSLYFVKDIKAGEVITVDHVKSIRPGYGLAPKNLERILGSLAKKSHTKGTPVTFDSF